MNKTKQMIKHLEEMVAIHDRRIEKAEQDIERLQNAIKSWREEKKVLEQKIAELTKGE
jgi:predicted  nucleic acid-binding Zn-ribbon protein